MNGQLAIEEVIAFFLSCFRPRLQNRIVLEFNGFVAPYADEMVVMMGIRLVQLVVLMALSQF